jgi:hypothetical protein
LNVQGILRTSRVDEELFIELAGTPNKNIINRVTRKSEEE